MTWPHPRSVDGGADRIPLPNSPGQLWLCGKHAIGPDPQRALDLLGLDTAVCLVRRHELADRYPQYVSWLDTHGAKDEPADGDGAAVWFPIADLHAPPLADYRCVLDGLHARLRRGNGLLVHCAAGIGRAGTTAVALCLLDGMALTDALTHVRAHRPMAGPEVGSQMALVHALATELAP